MKKKMPGAYLQEILATRTARANKRSYNGLEPEGALDANWAGGDESGRRWGRGNGGAAGGNEHGERWGNRR